MFKWLADMIVKTPVQGTCSCCEGKKELLKKMQKAILDGSESENLGFSGEDSCGCGGSCGHGDGHECSCQNGGKCEHRAKQGGIPFGATFASASYSVSYHFDQASGQYNRAVRYHAKHSAEDDTKHGAGSTKHDDENH